MKGKGLIKAIYAVTQDGSFGNKGKLPWPKNKQDMELFQKMTMNTVVVAGNRTWDSIGGLLRNRCCCRIGTNGFMFNEFFDKDVNCFLKNGMDVWVIGGASVLVQALPYIQEQYVSWIDGVYEADVRLDMKVMLDSFQLHDRVKYDGFHQDKYVRIGV